MVSAVAGGSGKAGTAGPRFSLIARLAAARRTERGKALMAESDEIGQGLGEDISHLIVDDDKPFLTRLARDMESRGAAIREKREDARTVILTGYGNIATAVTAVKLGAVDYLSKPADADDVYAALTGAGAGADGRAALPENPMSADRVRWEHIQRVYEMCDRNVSETARRLNMHRRTLQRILAKRAPR